MYVPLVWNLALPHSTVVMWFCGSVVAGGCDLPACCSVVSVEQGEYFWPAKMDDVPLISLGHHLPPITGVSRA